jgi:hypothetical protein
VFDDLVMSYLLSLYPEDGQEKGWGQSRTVSRQGTKEAEWATRERK